MDFGAGVTGFRAHAAVPFAYAGKQIEVRLDGVSGPLLGTLTVAGTGDWGNPVAQDTKVSGTTGVHDLYLAFRGGYGVGNLDWITFF